MNSKKVILDFVRPNLVPIIIFCLVPFIGWFFGVIALLCSVLPQFNRGTKLVKVLEERGELEKSCSRAYLS